MSRSRPAERIMDITFMTWECSASHSRDDLCSCLQVKSAHTGCRFNVFTRGGSLEEAQWPRTRLKSRQAPKTSSQDPHTCSRFMLWLSVPLITGHSLRNAHDANASNFGVELDRQSFSKHSPILEEHAQKKTMMAFLVSRPIYDTRCSS